jgi:hypothetical protein
MHNKQFRIKTYTPNYSKSLRFYDENRVEISYISIPGRDRVDTYTVPANTVWIKYDFGSEGQGRLYEFEPVI